MSWAWSERRLVTQDKLMSRSRCFRTFSASLLLLVATCTHAAEARIAVASNFRDTALAIAEQLEASSPHRYQIITGSTGKLASQIINGAPFDVLMAADQRRPRELESRGLAVTGSVMTYALGEIGLWWPKGPDVLNLERLAELPAGQVCIANPAVAPYGDAAIAVLSARSMDSDWLDGLIRVDNVNLVTGWVATGQASAGFVARSALISAQRRGEVLIGTDDIHWIEDHPPIAQAMAVIKRAADNPAAVFWARQIRTEPVQSLLERDGYRIPQVSH